MQPLPPSGAMSLTISTAPASSIPSLLGLLLLATTASARPQQLPPQPPIWTIQVDNSPAPPPDKGPPLSAHAIRDKGYLPVQVGSIFAAYCLVVISLSVAVLTVGRRLRASARTSPQTLGMEIVPRARAPPGGSGEHPPSYGSKTPLSPGARSSAAGWSAKTGWSGFRKPSQQHRKNDSLAEGSVMTFDDSVIEEDRARNEIEMDRLYAAVAAHEGQKSAPVSVTEFPRSPGAPPNSVPHYHPSPPPQQQQYQPQHPPELQHLRAAGASLPPSQFPLTPPSDMDAPPSRQQTTSPRRQPRPSPISTPGNGGATTTGSPSRASSRSSVTSATSFGKKRGINVRALPISPPVMGSADLRPDAGRAYADSEPLSPRVYTPGPPPPTPPQQRRMQHLQQQQQSQQQHGQQVAGSEAEHYQQQQPSRKGSGAASDLRVDILRSNATGGHHAPGSPMSPRDPHAQALGSPHFQPGVRSSRASGDSDGARSPGFSPRAAAFAPPAIVEEPPSGTASPVTSERSGGRGLPRGKPAPLPLGGTAGASQGVGSAGSSQHTLPLRALRSPNSLRPPSMIRATEVDRPERRGQTHGPTTAGGTQQQMLRSPLTGVPATPYSPYCPQTPLTPMTPSRLVTREERRRKKKEEGRRVLTQDDMVPEEDDQFGSAY